MGDFWKFGCRRGQAESQFVTLAHQRLTLRMTFHGAVFGLTLILKGKVNTFVIHK